MAPIVAPTVANMVLTVGQVFEMFFLHTKLYAANIILKKMFMMCLARLRAVNHGCVD